MNRYYSVLIKLETFIERYEYLKLNANIGNETFGYDRYINQALYLSEEWKRFRREIIIRDNGCDLGLDDRPIFGNKIIIHHLNPLTKRQILDRDPCVFNPENVICCRHQTHMAIHYGSFENINDDIIVRSANDTCPWRR